jgi:glutamate dehydrogenase
MAITARGAWECVKRHFREIGVDISASRSRSRASATWPATCSATACCSRRTSGWSRPSIISTSSSTREPDAARSFARTRRLFELPRSSWDDYSRKLISKGGGIYARSLKSLSLSREAQALLGAAREFDAERGHQGDPEGAGRLLWNGGIGTYVKASDESHATSATAATTRVRIDARDCAARSSAKAAISDSRSAGASNSRGAAAGSTPISSTTRPA